MVYRFSVTGVPVMRVVVFAFVASFVSLCCVAQTHSGFPVDSGLNSTDYNNSKFADSAHFKQQTAKLSVNHFHPVYLEF
jgi:hypothetical protein